jgi:hypothetical protein
MVSSLQPLLLAAGFTMQPGKCDAAATAVLASPFSLRVFELPQITHSRQMRRTLAAPLLPLNMLNFAE